MEQKEIAAKNTLKINALSKLTPRVSLAEAARNYRMAMDEENSAENDLIFQRELAHNAAVSLRNAESSLEKAMARLELAERDADVCAEEVLRAAENEGAQ